VTEYCLVATDFGPVGLAWTARGLIGLQLPEPDGAISLARLLRRREAAETEAPKWLQPTVNRLQRYFTGAQVDLSHSPIDFDGVPAFFRLLYFEMLEIGWGETVSYGELARRVGSPGAARAVGQAMSHNAIPVIIPCHRVLASGQRSGGFSASGGVGTKLRLLELEGVRLGTPQDASQLAFAF
jgi:methylated-DNA-[protein]-cysteine S-methyltransferase